MQHIIAILQSSRIVSYRIVSYRIVSYRIVSYNNNNKFILVAVEHVDDVYRCEPVQGAER